MLANASHDWKIMPRLSLSLGVRYERELMPSPFANLINPLVPQTGRCPTTGTTLVRASGLPGCIRSRVRRPARRLGYLLWTYHQLHRFQRSDRNRDGWWPDLLQLLSNVVGAPAFPIVSATPPPERERTSPLDANFQNPQIRQMDLTLEHIWMGLWFPPAIWAAMAANCLVLLTQHYSSSSTLTYQVAAGASRGQHLHNASVQTVQYCAATDPATANTTIGSMTDIVAV